MALIDKEDFDKRRENAASRHLESAKIETLTPKQHEVLAELCSMRHHIHKAHSKMWNSESDMFIEYWTYIDEEMNAELTSCGLDTINVGNSDLVENDCSFRENWDEEKYPDIEDWKQYCIEQMIEWLSNYNNKVESYLREIDKQHSTEYCPMGVHRMY